MIESGAERTRKVLLVRVGRGGDLVMVTPAFDALITLFPDAEFHVLTTAEGRRILAGQHDRITRMVEYSRRFPARLRRERELRRQFAAERYDRIYVFETAPHYARWLAGLAPRIHALAGDGAAGRHFSDRCLDLVAGSVGGEAPRGRVRLQADDEGRRRARALLTDHGVVPQATLVGLHPTFSGSRLRLRRDRRGDRHRAWPPEAFAEVARLLVDRAAADHRPLAVVIDALPDDERRARDIAERSGGAVTVLAAPPDFRRYKGLLALLDLLITPNTGPMHMAAALGTPLVALFSHWSPADCGPYTDPDRYVVLRAEDAPDPGRGLAAIAPDVVAEAAWAMLDRGGAHR